METYINLSRSVLTEDLMKYPNALMLFTQIALRARRTNAPNINKLKIREVLIGDYHNIGLSRQNYRTSLKKLTSLGLITYRTTNRGTIATICDNGIYAINADDSNRPFNHQLTINQPRGNRQVTNNKNVNENVNEKNNYKILENGKTHKRYSKPNEARNSKFAEKDYSKGF